MAEKLREEKSLEKSSEKGEEKSSVVVDRTDICRQKHYNMIAPRYDEMKGQRTYQERSDIVCKWLNIRPDDKVVDIGAGTGGVSTLVWKKLGLQSPLLAVDPSHGMIEIAKHKEGLITMEATFDEFLDSGVIPNYNKFFLFGCIHHFPQLPIALKKFYELLKDGDQVLIIDKVEILLWEDAKKAARNASLQEVETYLQAAGFSNIKRGEEIFVYNVQKEDYFNKLRNRLYSVISVFTDEEIEVGIKELDETIFKGAEYKDLNDINYILFVTK